LFSINFKTHVLESVLLVVLNIHLPETDTACLHIQEKDCAVSHSRSAS